MHGRSVGGNLSPYGRPETIDETAAIIKEKGGTAIAVRVDHTVESEVESLFARIDREHSRMDVLVNSIAGEEPMMAQWDSFWKTNLKDGEAILRQALLSHIITAKHAAPLMIRRRRGLIVEVTENDILMAGGNPLSQTVKLAVKGLALNMAAELKPHGVAAIANDFSGHSPSLIELMRNGAEIQLAWLEALTKRTERFLGQLAHARPAPTRTYSLMNNRRDREGLSEERLPLRRPR